MNRLNQIKNVGIVVLLCIAAAIGSQAQTLPSTRNQQAQLTASDGVANDNFGSSVAISGTTAVVGAPFHMIGSNQWQGAAYVFVEKEDGTWIKQAELTASDGEARDSFGSSVALSGDTAVIAGGGRVYVFTQRGETWNQQAELTAGDAGNQFGSSVAIDGNTIVVGAQAQKVNAIQNEGAAYVFVGSGGTWTQQAKLIAGIKEEALPSFGSAVAVSGSTVVVGARGWNRSQGKTYVFSGSSGTWVQQASLTAADGIAGELFGGSVAVSGKTAIVGASNHTVRNNVIGAAYVFVQRGTTWTLQTELAAPNGARAFGQSVAVDGSTIAVGAPASSQSGSAYVFGYDKTSGVWNPQAVSGDDGNANDHFGISVAVSKTTALVGAMDHPVGSNTSRGAAYVFASPTVTLSPPSLTFKSQAINTTGTARTVDFRNTGTDTLDISSIAFTLGTNFAISSNTCGATLAANRTCRVSVTFTPTQVGTLSDTLIFTDDASDSPQTLPVSGTGAAGAATVTPTSMDFGDVGVALSNTLQGKLSNNLSTTLTGISVSTTAPFSVDTLRGCPATLGPHATCPIVVKFDPSQLGPATGTLTVTDSASNSPQTISLSGTGIGSAAIVPSSMMFPVTEVGDTSSAKLADLHSYEGKLLNISFSTTGPFAIASTTCGTTLGRGDGCTMHVTFTPTQSGTATGKLTVTDSDGTQTISLSGTGTTNPVYASPASVDFGGQSVGTTSSQMAIDLFNTGSQQITVTSVSASGDFTVTENHCMSGVKANSHCWVGVVFSPTQSGTLSGILTFVDNATNSPQTVTLSGTGN